MKNINYLMFLAPFVMLIVPKVHAAPPLSGAIFTTFPDGSIVNANTQYTSKCQVYLDGGPGPNAPIGAAGLPQGEYYFQVTDPSGRNLLSTDIVRNRRFRVNASGVIDAYTGTGGPVHPVGVDMDHGSTTIQLANTSCPTDFKDTPNNGGVFKVWVTPVGDFVGDPGIVDNACGNGCFHGFRPAASKTDNFKVKGTGSTFCLTIKKSVIDDKGTTTPGVGWEFWITEPLKVTNGNNFTYVTNGFGELEICDLEPGAYTVEENQKSGYFVYQLYFNGKLVPADAVYSFSWTKGKPAPVLEYVNALPKSAGK